MLQEGYKRGKESYHRQLKSRIKCGHPRIGNFLKVLDELILCKQKLTSGTPLQFLKSNSRPLGHVTEEKEDYISDFSDRPDSDQTNTEKMLTHQLLF